MTISTNIHRVAKVELSELRHFPIEEGKYGGPEFWSRDVLITDQKGDVYTVTMITGQNPKPEDLMTPGEVKEQADRLGAVEAAIAEEQHAADRVALAVESGQM